MKFLVTFIFETSKRAESDLQRATTVIAPNWREALVLARKILKTECPGLNFAKNWYWDVVGKPQ